MGPVVATEKYKDVETRAKSFIIFHPEVKLLMLKVRILFLNIANGKV